MQPTSCPDCTTAKARPWHGFTSGCRGCDARALSRSPHVFESRRRNKQTPEYRAALALAGLTHADVLEAGRTDAIRKDGTT